MAEKPKYRRVSPAEWIGLAGIGGAILTFAVYGGEIKQQVFENTKDISGLTEQIQKSEKRVMKAIKDVDERNRADQKEMRQDIKQLLLQTR